MADQTPHLVTTTPRDPVSPAYAYGALLGRMRDGYIRMMKDIADGFNARPARRLSDEEIEALAMARWRADIDRQRRQGLAFVRETARAARRDLGLPV